MRTTSHRPALTPAAFLLRGLAVGLVAGLLAFAVASLVGEPYVDEAVALEQATSAHPTHGETDAAEASADAHAEVSRTDQRSWGLLTGLLAVGAALGGLTALASAAAVGRLGSLSARGSTAVVATVGFVAVALVPFLKYPANPPGVGAGATIGTRTAAYFGFLAISVLAAVVAVVVARLLAERLDGYTATVLAASGYLVVVVVTGLLLPAVDEVGDFPADTLWLFRRASLMTLATTWAAIGVGLVTLVGRLHDGVRADAERRALAASL